MGPISAPAVILLVQLISLGFCDTTVTTESKNCSQISIIHQDLHCDGPGKFPLKDTCEFYYECIKKGTAEATEGDNDNGRDDHAGYQYQLVKARCPEGAQFDGMECVAKNETSAECPQILCPILGDFSNVPAAENVHLHVHAGNETKHNGPETEPDFGNVTVTVTASMVLVLAPDNLTGDAEADDDDDDEGVMLGDDPAAGTGTGGAANEISMRSGAYKATPKEEEDPPATTAVPKPDPVTVTAKGGHDDHSGHSHDHGHRHSHNRRKVVKNGGPSAVVTGWSHSHVLALVHVVWPMFFALFL